MDKLYLLAWFILSSQFCLSIDEMKKFLLLAILGLLYSQGAIAQANLKFVKKSYEFAPFEKGKKYFYRFEFTNKGTATLFISFVRMTDPDRCKVEWPKSVIQPGENGFITVHIDLEHFSGTQYSNSLMVYSNCPAPANMKTIEFSGKVIEKPEK